MGALCGALSVGGSGGGLSLGPPFAPVAAAARPMPRASPRRRERVDGKLPLKGQALLLGAEALDCGLPQLQSTIDVERRPTQQDRRNHSNQHCRASRVSPRGDRQRGRSWRRRGGDERWWRRKRRRRRRRRRLRRRRARGRWRWGRHGWRRRRWRRRRGGRLAGRRRRREGQRRRGWARGAEAVADDRDAMLLFRTRQAMLLTAVELLQVHKPAVHPHVEVADGPLHDKFTLLEEAGALLVELAVEGSRDQCTVRGNASVEDGYSHRAHPGGLGWPPCLSEVPPSG